MLYREIPKKEEMMKVDSYYTYKQITVMYNPDLYRLYEKLKPFDNKFIIVKSPDGNITKGLLKNLDLLEKQSIPLLKKNNYDHWEEHQVRTSEIKAVQECDFDLCLCYGLFL